MSNDFVCVLIVYLDSTLYHWQLQHRQRAQSSGSFQQVAFIEELLT